MLVLIMASASLAAAEPSCDAAATAYAEEVEVYTPPGCAALLASPGPSCKMLAQHRGSGLPLGMEASVADLSSGCGAWAALGECSRNAAYMEANCCMSCLRHVCLRTQERPAHAPRQLALDSVASHARWRSLLDHEARLTLARYPYDAADDECSASASADDESLTYGEVSVAGMGGLVATLRGAELAGTSCALNKSSTFFEIGSGLGRLALYVRLSSGARRVVGVELSECRHRRAMAMAQEVGLPEDRLAFYQGDAATTEHGSEATHWFMSPICFSEPTLRALARRARDAEEPPACIISFGRELRPSWLPADMAPLLSESLPATFQSSALVTYYGRRVP